MFAAISARNTAELDAMFTSHSLDLGIQQVIFPQEAEFVGKPRSRHASLKQGGETSRTQLQRIDSFSSDEETCSEDNNRERSVTVNGADIGDLPTEYLVEGLRGNEVPVIGTYIDRSVVPGFRYRVRKLGSEQFLFKGKAMRLMSIGMGYGKRITFEGETLNQNSNYFYSDTNPEGYGFSLVAAEPRDVFIVNDDVRLVAEAKIENVLNEKEISSEVEEDGSLVKKVAITFTCSIDYAGDNHGLMPLFTSERLHLEGMAIIIRNKSARQAHTKFIQQVDLPLFGNCNFHA